MSIRSLKSAVKTLDRHPPRFAQGKARGNAFLKIGEFLESSIRPGQPHDLEQNPNAVWQIIESRLVGAVMEMSATDRGEGIVLWQMYNSGVILKSDDVVLGLDVVPMLRTYGWDEPEGLTESLARLLDFLLITHHHPDHYDKKLVRACLKLGKPVCMPAALAKEWESDPNLYPALDGWSLELADIHILGRRGIHVWRETADDVPCVYYEVTCQSGYTFLFAGDADYTKLFEKTPGRAVDLLFLPWRSPNEFYEEGDPKQMGKPADAVKIAVQRTQPRSILFEHYAELEHVHDGFPASYDIALDLKGSLETPSEWLFWGESMTLAK